MSRVAVWLCLSAAGFLYWGVVHRFAQSGIDHFAGPVWFGGGALLVHWCINRREAEAPSAASASSSETGQQENGNG
jgi:hypothetical protein